MPPRGQPISLHQCLPYHVTSARSRCKYTARRVGISRFPLDARYLIETPSPFPTSRRLSECSSRGAQHYIDMNETSPKGSFQSCYGASGATPVMTLWAVMMSSFWSSPLSPQMPTPSSRCLQRGTCLRTPKIGAKLQSRRPRCRRVFS